MSPSFTSAKPSAGSTSSHTTISEPNAQAMKIKKPLVTFMPRPSVFDRHNQAMNKDPFRGFYALFWLLLAFHIFATLHASGSLTIQAPFARLFSQHLPQLALLDLCLVGSTTFALGFVQLIVKKVVRYSPTGQVLQHVFQCVWLCFWIYYIFSRQWPWVQSGFLTLHSLTMLMKMHSYCATNGAFSEKHRLLQFKLVELEKLLINKGHIFGDKTLASLKPVAVQEHLAQIVIKEPEAKVVEKAQEVLDFFDDLGARADDGKCWPQNVTVANFADYLLVPTLVYEMRYPRTKEIRYWFVAEKILATAGTFGLLYMITQYYIWNQIPSAGEVTEFRSFFGVVLRLLVPFTINYLLLFYIIFECICNGFAELTRFADREFYSDWWNSVSFEEFSRKWNKPVHTFLLKHVYASSITAYGFSRFGAAVLTLLLSSLVHELVMTVVTRKWRLYLFLAQMAQLPLTYVGKSRFVLSHPGLGNVFFWFGLLSGFPILGVCYIFY